MSLYECASLLEERGAEVIAVAMEETGLSEARLQGELARTTGQLRLLADVKPWRREAGGIVTVPVPVGRVAVFAASNFPLAFGVLGGDTASATAAGCPVTVKAHPAQPALSSLLAGIGSQTLPGFEIVYGGPATSIALVQDPRIKAVGFTGSLAGGRALMDAAAARPDPIPVDAEMGSLNPVFVLPGYDGDVAALAASVTGSSGQLCTKPGLVVTPSASFARSLADAVAASPTHRMLTPHMASAHADWLSSASEYGEVVAGQGDPAPFAVIVDSLAAASLREEHFGPSVVIYVGSEVPALEGSLTATILAGPSDLDSARSMLPALMSLAGRVVWNGVPTGVLVNEAQQHGGPWPATSASWSTSVGTESIERFRRPVALQGVPAELL